MRLIDADALKKQWSMADKCEDCPQNARHCQFEQDFTRMDICEMIDEAPTVGGWISVKDRMPPNDDTKVMTYGNPVTHWMPLPEPPKEVSGDAAEGNKR